MSSSVSLHGVGMSCQAGYFEALSGQVVAGALGKIALGVLAFSAVSAGVGTLLQLGEGRVVAGSSQVGTSTVVAQVGNQLFLAGRYAFLSVAVPVYTAVWIVPKKVYHYVIVPVFNGLVRVAEYFAEVLEKVAQAVYNWVLKPLEQLIERVVIWTWNAVIIHVVRGVMRAAEQVKDELYRISIALLDCALKIYENIVLPLYRLIVPAAHRIWNAVILPIWNTVVQTVEQIYRGIRKVAQAIYDYVLSPLRGAIVEATKWVWQMLLEPVGRAVISAAEVLKDAVVMPIIRGVIQVCGVLKTPVVQTAQIIYDFISKALGVVSEYTGQLFTVVANAVNVIYTRLG